MTFDDKMAESGFKILYRMPFIAGNVSAPRMVEMFGWGMTEGMLWEGEEQDRRWFIEICFGEALYAFKDANDAVLFKLAFSTPKMITQNLQG